MKINVEFTSKNFEAADVKIFAAFQKEDKNKKVKLSQSWFNKDFANHFDTLKVAKTFTGVKGSSVTVTGTKGETVIIIGMGDKSKAKAEEIRRAAAAAYKAVSGKKYTSVSVDAESFNCIKDSAQTIALLTEGLQLTAYSFDKYLAKKSENSFNAIVLSALITK